MEMSIFVALWPGWFKGSCMLAYRILLKDGQFSLGHVAWSCYCRGHRYKQAALQGSSSTVEWMLLGLILPNAIVCML